MDINSKIRDAIHNIETALEYINTLYTLNDNELNLISGKELYNILKDKSPIDIDNIVLTLLKEYKLRESEQSFTNLKKKFNEL